MTPDRGGCPRREIQSSFWSPRFPNAGARVHPLPSTPPTIWSLPIFDRSHVSIPAISSNFLCLDLHGHDATQWPKHIFPTNGENWWSFNYHGRICKIKHHLKKQILVITWGTNPSIPKLHHPIGFEVGNFLLGFGRMQPPPNRSASTSPSSSNEDL